MRRSFAWIPSALPAGDESTSRGLLSDEAIDSAVQPVMQGDEFLSLRRRVLEQVAPVEDNSDSGFLGDSLEWLGEQLSTALTHIGNFLEWLFIRPFSRAPVPRNGGGNSVTSQMGEGWFSQWLTGTWGLSADTARFVMLVVLILLILSVTLIIAMLFLRIEKRRRLSALLPDDALLAADITAPPGELPAATYEGRASRYAADGNYRMAIRELLLGSMSWIERAGLIRYRRGLTNRDYVRCVWRRPSQRESMLATASSFELIWFGRRTPTEEMFVQCLAGFQGAFREEDATPAG
ncbi:MAG: DUF4129 domain-containing protein [Planctomycetaceae bacterium]